MASIFDQVNRAINPTRVDTTTEEVNIAYNEEARMQQEDNQYIKKTAPPINQLEQISNILTPSQIEDKYHLRIVKEWALSQIDKGEVAIAMRYVGLIYQFAYDGLDEMADILHAELMTRTMLYRSVGGWQQNTINKNTQEIVRTVKTDNEKRGN